MKDPRSILVILDKPKHQQSALAEARRIQAAVPGVQLRLVSFVWHAIVEQKGIYDAQQRRAMKREIVRTRKAWVRNLVRDEKLLEAPASIEVVWTAHIADWVEAQSPRTDLVIKSVHKSRKVLHTPLDWELIRTCPKPLLLVCRYEGKRRRKAGNSDVIATVDLRHRDRRHQTLNLRVLDAAVRFARIRGGRVHCVAVVEFSEVLSDLEIIDPRKIRREQIEASAAFLDALLEPYGIPRSRIHRPAGKVGHLVAATARKTGAGLVVVGSAARRAGGLRVLGGSAEKIVDRSPTDVLVVHP